MASVLNETAAPLDRLSDAELAVLERRVAGRYLRVFPWGIVLWGFTNTTVWLALWPLVLLDLLPLWAAFPIAVLNVALAYLPSHDAQHSIIARKGQRLRWLNELLGYYSLIPLATSFRVLRHTHFEHHNHTNDPALDPDYDVHARSVGHFLRKHVGRPNNGAYLPTLARLGRKDLIVEAVAYQVGFLVLLFAGAWLGYAIEVALLWWLPRHLALLHIQYYLSWMPHHPGVETGRYRDTRAFRSVLGNLWSMGMQFHIVHHLYPTIPLMKTPAAYWDLKPILERKECDLGGL